MTEQNAVPLIVLSSTRDPVEAINSILRRAGQPVHCTWIPALRDLADALTQINPELLIHVVPVTEELKSAIAVRDQVAPTVPVIGIGEHADEARIGQALEAGARDFLSFGNPARLQAVMLRELRSFRLERALSTTLKSARDARRQLETVLQRSNDAIVQVQEGIVVDANPSWLELFGFAESLVGQPIMDLFDEATQPALKGALAACLQGRWSDHTLKVNAVLADGSSLPVEVVLALGEHDGEPCVRLVVPSTPRDERKLAEDLTEVVRSDSATGFLHRRELLEALRQRLANPAAGGMRYITIVKLDKFASVERDVGATASEEVLIEFAKLLKAALHPKEIVGRFGGVKFLILLERGNEHDVEAWGEQLLGRVQKHVFRVRDKTVTVTCTVGFSVVAAGQANLDALIADALDANQKGRHRGGNQTVTSDKADADTRVQSYDKVWVKHIKAALMENRFRLVQQPVASLQGEDPGMFDVLVRMIDLQGKEVLPSEFMAAAERNDLLKNIDRWVVGASLSFAAQRKPGCLFVRLSKDTTKDGTFVDWLDNHVRSSRAEPQRLCFQVTEEIASAYLAQVKALATVLRQSGFRFALDGFGSGRDPKGLLESVPLDFVKVDGAIVQGLTADQQLQQRVRHLVDQATKRQVQTIAERVEDANTMAILWQIGVQYIQGYFVNEPEQVVLRAER
ncbi:MAG TPA: EAL domain-containing protein [Steroidobacteraceae bacterium]|nr:EAL domain-containing protein [Steroidobacteraceae bacterium]